MVHVFNHITPHNVYFFCTKPTYINVHSTASGKPVSHALKNCDISIMK